MDPNATLRLLRDKFNDFSHTDTDEDIRYRYYEIEDLFTSLDVWLTKGAFLPDAWER